MKIKFEDQVFRGTFDPSVDDRIDEILSLPDIDPDNAFLLKKAFVGVTPPIATGSFSVFEWGLSWRPGDWTVESGIINQPGLVCFSTHNLSRYSDPESGNGDQFYFDIGGFRDQINFDSDANTYGVIKNELMRKVHFFIFSDNIVYDHPTHVNLRLLYDVVSLSTAEQAELYQQSSGCCC
jgi:hypothetical protein